MESSISDLQNSKEVKNAYNQARQTMENAVLEVQLDMDYQRQRKAILKNALSECQ